MRALVAERQTADIPLADIARRAGLSRQTLYLNYSDRDSVIAHAAVRSVETVIGRGRAECAERRELTETILRHLREQDRFYIPVFEQRSGRFCGVLEEFFASQSQKKLEAARVVDAAVIASFVAGGSITVIRQWLTDVSFTAASPAEIAGRLDTMITRLTARNNPKDRT